MGSIYQILKWEGGESNVSYFSSLLSLVGLGPQRWSVVELIYIWFQPVEMDFFFLWRNHFYAHKGFSPTYIYPFCHRDRRKKSLCQFPSKAQGIQFSSSFHAALRRTHLNLGLKSCWQGWKLYKKVSVK